LICSNAELSKIDLRLNQAFYALRYGLDPSGRSALDAEDRDFVNEVTLACGMPESGPAVGGSPDCIAEWYGRKRSQWMSRLTGTAFEEASRSLEQCISLQTALQRLQFLPSSASIDGVYGGVTRTAIVAWQQAKNREATGIIGNADAVALIQETPLPQIAAIQPASPTEGQSSPVAPIVTQGGSVQLRERGGVYRLPVRINDTITLDFTLDSGAADVQIPADVVLTLIRSETLTPRDFQGERIYEQADGSKSPSQRFILRELRVGDHRLTNVAASVGDTKGGLLLGQSFLSRFKSWTLDNEQHVVTLTER
jgi:predicted aspartyl protease